MKLAKNVLNDARRVAGGLYGANASGANRYGFIADKEGKEVGYGEFLWPSESEGRVDWIIELESGKVRQANKGAGR